MKDSINIGISETLQDSTVLSGTVSKNSSKRNS